MKWTDSYHSVSVAKGVVSKGPWGCMNLGNG
jgi:hypothetical protein